MKQGLTDVTLIVDRSGSMGPIAEETRRGIKKLVEDQRKVPGECLLSLVEFDDQIERPFTAKRLEEVGDIPLEPRGSTALFDAMGTTIVQTGVRLAALSEDARPEKVIMVIITDGYENFSRLFKKHQVFDLVRQQRENYKWEFVFLGANEDAISTATEMGIAAANAASYKPNTKGVGAMYANISSNMTRSRQGGTLAFDPSQRNDMIDKPKN